jgi:pyrophosphatase PpaX
MRRPPAILFDLDGTLVDTVELILASMRHAFDGYAAGCPTDAEWIAGIGTPLRAQLTSFARSPGDVEHLVERYRAHQSEHHDRMTRCYEGARETVALLRGRGHPLAVVTSKHLAPAERTLRHVGLARYVEVVVGADSCERHKPDPAPVLLALARLGYPPAEALFVGDSPHDVAAGNSAGVVTVAALWGACSRDALERASPGHLLREIGELPALVERFEARPRT